MPGPRIKDLTLHAELGYGVAHWRLSGKPSLADCALYWYILSDRIAEPEATSANGQSSCMGWFALLLLDGYSYKEMSSIIGITESNVGVKINRIKKHLIDKSKDI